MTHRLNKSMRDEIVTRMLKHRFKAEIEKYYDATAKLANKIYADIFDTATQTQLVLLPVGWVPEPDHIGVYLGPSYTNVYFGGDVYAGSEIRQLVAPERLNRRVPNKMASGCAKVYEARHDLAIQHSKLEAQKSKLIEEIKQTKVQCESAVRQVTTVERLVEVWPESVIFVADYLKAEPRQLPTVRTEELNALLRLP